MTSVFQFYYAIGLIFLATASTTDFFREELMRQDIAADPKGECPFWFKLVAGMISAFVMAIFWLPCVLIATFKYLRGKL